MTRILLSSPDVGDLEETYLVDAIRSGWAAPLGPHVDAFEHEMAARLGAGHAVALSSGTAALHLGLLAWGIGPGDVVVTSTMTFAATANAICYTGAEPFFVDSEPESGNLDPDLLDDALSALLAAGRRVKAIVPVDLLGQCVDQTAVGKVAERHRVPVLADSAESLGAVGDVAAAGAWGEAAILSFNGNKVMTTSGGGMYLTANGDAAERVRYLATQARQPTLHYEHTEVGYNYRLSNLLAAVGRAQLQRLDSMVNRRKHLRARYSELFTGIAGVRLLGDRASAHGNAWLTAIVVEAEEAGWGAAELGAHLAALEVETRPVWKPMHLQPAFRQYGSLTRGVSDDLFADGLVLPSGSVLGDAEIDSLVSEISRFLQGFW
jgi:dTDP-4-amino-4,6-dideoxygalactose transaminase